MQLFLNGSCKGLHCTSMCIFSMFEAIGRQKLTKKMAAEYAQFPCFPCLTSFCEESLWKIWLNFGKPVTWDKSSIYANFQVFGTNLHSMIFFKNGVICAKNMFVQNHNVGSLLMFDPYDFNSFSKVVINCQTVPLCQYSHNFIP